MFEKNVAAMVRGLRERPNDAGFVSATLAEIKQELASMNFSIKTNAFLKLGYLSMLGVDLSIAQMPIVEVMSSSQFVLKRPAMFVASLAFKGSNSSISLLTTNIFLKELGSPNYFEIATAVSCLSAICTVDIANGVVDAVVLLCTHSKPYVRKKAALALFKLCEVNPALFVSVAPKLKDLLSDSDQSVQAAAVSAFVEIASRNPKLVVPNIPIFFHLLKEIKNNWMLIKLLKLTEKLCAVEPRLWAKLIQSNVLGDLIASTKAKSVQVEFTRFVLTVGARSAAVSSEQEHAIVDRAFVLLVEFLESPDPNIRCIAMTVVDGMLTGLTTDSAVSNSLVVKRETIFNLVVKGVDSTDATMRKSALSALTRLVNSADSATHVIQQLLALFTKFESKKTIQLQIVLAILRMAQHDSYAFIKDTEWYLRILILLGCESCLDEQTALAIANQYKAVVGEREAETGLRISVAALGKDDLSSVLTGACAWTVGEYAFAHWSVSLFDTATCNRLVKKLIERSRKSCIETQIDCVWGALKLVVAAALKSSNAVALSHEFEEAIVELCRTEKSASIALSEVCSIALGVIKLVQTEDAKLADISKLLFDRKTCDEPLIVPQGLDEPFIELPASMKVDAKSFSAWEEVTEVYTDSEPVESASVELPSDAMFSVESVMRPARIQ